MYKIYSVNNEEKGIFINLKKLQVNNYGELLFLNEYLEKYSNYNNLILINVIPIDNISNNIIDITKENNDYVEKIYSMIKNYNNINICFSSSNVRILNKQKKKFINNNCGYYLTDDLNYPDCTFYVLLEKKYNRKKIDLEIKNNHKIFIITTDDTIPQLENEIKKDFDNYNNIFLIKKTL